MLDAVEGSGEIHPQDTFPFFERHLPDGPVLEDAGVINQNIKPAKIRFDLLHHCADLLRVSHITLNHSRAGQSRRHALRSRLVPSLGILEVIHRAPHAEPAQSRDDPRSDTT